MALLTRSATPLGLAIACGDFPGLFHLAPLGSRTQGFAAESLWDSETKHTFAMERTAVTESIAASFERQSFMRLIGAELVDVKSGEVRISMPFRDDLCQQNGFIHAGVITAIVDSACGYAAKSMMPPQSEVLSVEYKINFVRPAKGERFEAVGRVVRAGKTLTICSGEILAWEGAKSEVIAVMQATMIATSA